MTDADSGRQVPPWKERTVESSRSNSTSRQSEGTAPSGYADSTSEQQFALTLDLENDWYFDEPGYDHLTFEYIDDFIELVNDLGVPLTVFVVGKTLEKYPEEIDQLATEIDTEFHLHSYHHEESDTTFREELRLGKEAFRSHFGYDPVGYRAPYGKFEPEQFSVLADEGFRFDSSIFPSYRPGVYSNLNTPLEPYVPEYAPELLEIPLGVFRGIRIPLSQNYLKLFGRPLLELLSLAPLPNTLVYNVHLQDLYETESHEKLGGLKQHIINRNLGNSVQILEESVERITESGYEPTTLSDIHAQYWSEKVRQ